MTREVAYAPGKVLEAHGPTGPGTAPVVVLWHGSGPDERDALAPLAAAVARHGALVLVPDWQSDDPTTGARQLRSSLAFARHESAGLGGDPDRLVLAGWSLGASAALWVGLHPHDAGVVPSAVVGLGGSYAGSPFGDHVFAGRSRAVGNAAPAPRAVLVHGDADHLVAPERSAGAADRLDGLGWSVQLHLVHTDHAGVIGTVYDRSRARCVPTDDPVRAAVLDQVAALIAGVARAV